MLALIGNEFVKIFHKKLTYVVLIVILLCSAAVPFVGHYAEQYDNSNYYAENLQSEKSYIEEAISEGTENGAYHDIVYNKASLDSLNLRIASGVESYDDWREEAAYRLVEFYTERYLIDYYLQKDKKAIKYLEENNMTYEIDPDALTYYYSHRKSLRKLNERYEELGTVIGNYENAIRNNDPTYVNQLSVDLAQEQLDATQKNIDDLAKSLKKASSSEKESINKQIEAETFSLQRQTDMMVWLQYRVDHAISRDYFDWKNRCVSRIEYAVSRTYDTPMTKEEFDASDNDMSYEEYLAKYEADIAAEKDAIVLYQHALDNNIPPADYVSSTRSHLQNIYFLIVLVSLGAILIGSSLVSREYSTGTIRLLLIRPKRRYKILLSKFLSVLFIAAILLVLCFGCYLAATISAYGAEDFAYPILSVADGVVTETPVMQTILPVFIQSSVVVLFLFSLAFFFGSVVKSTVLAVALPMGIVACSGLCFQLLAEFGFYKIASFSFLPYMQLWNVINKSGTVGYYMSEKPLLHMSASYGFWLLIALSAVCLAISFWVFGKRDVKN